MTLCRIKVRMRPQITVPHSESSGFFMVVLPMIGAANRRRPSFSAQSKLDCNPSDGAYPVAGFTGGAVDSMRASAPPRAKRSATDSPAISAALSLTTAPSAFCTML